MCVGKKIWVFPDGDLPAASDGPLKGHESLIILNSSNKDSKISFEIYFEEKDPVKDITATVKAQRVRCFRLDSPIGDDKTFQIPFGQYALIVISEQPVVAQIGRMDVSQPNLAYYTVMGYCCD